MSITKHISESLLNTCKDNLYDAQEHIEDLDKSLYECNRISRSWKAQWENVLHENALLKKDNAYLLEQLPIQKQQQYDSGMKFATKEYQERIKEIEEELDQSLTVHAEYSNRMELKLSELEEALKK